MDIVDDERDGVVINPEPPRIIIENFTQQVLEGPDEGCLNNFRMDKQVFAALETMLRRKALLHNTWDVKIVEQLAIFLYLIGHSVPFEDVQDLFLYSKTLISRHFNGVLDAIFKLSPDLFDSPASDVPLEISKDPKFYPFFKDCLGFVDAVQLKQFVDTNDLGVIHAQNGRTKALAICSFDLRFKKVFAASDGSLPRGLYPATSKLEIPEGKYYLVDDAYQDIPGFVAPYVRAVYFSGDICFDFGTQEQLFNQRHWDMRKANKIIFSILKERFPILMSTLYPAIKKLKLVVVCCALHNFIQKMNPDDAIFRKHQNVIEADLIHEGGDLPLNEEFDSEPRSSIARDLWEDYAAKHAT
ncbi:hypothetical protein ACFE04_009977 [Oxalis oulophora]